LDEELDDVFAEHEVKVRSHLNAGDVKLNANYRPWNVETTSGSSF
jgi:hypothetical protein